MVSNWKEYGGEEFDTSSVCSPCYLVKSRITKHRYIMVIAIHHDDGSYRSMEVQS